VGGDPVTDSAATPSGVRVIAHMPDGTEVNVTEGVQVLYDTVIASMDWGSGFLTVEDALPIVQIAKACGFAGWEEAQRYVNAQAHSEEQARFLRERSIPKYDAMRQPHDHIYSSVGKCMWPGCQQIEGATSE
jgi:hypothetical protein